MRILVVLLLAGIIISCDDMAKESAHSEPVLEYTFLAKENHTNPRIRGVWKSIGNGYFIEVKEDRILLYSYTKSYSYKEKNDYLEGLLNTQSQFSMQGDTIGIYLTDYGEETKVLQTKKDFIKIDKLPNNCMTFDEMTELNVKSQFNLYQETLEENYAFTKERKLNWKDLFKAYQDSLSSNDHSLFESMGEIAISTKDQHTKVISSDGTKRQYRVTPSALDVQHAFENQTEVENLNEYFDLFFKKNKLNISNVLLTGKGKKVLNGNIEWGKINDKTGYIALFSFAGFLSRDYTRKQQVDSIKFHMNEIINSLQTTNAIIIDISFNFGGYDASAATIAGYFTTEPVYAFTSQVYHDGKFYSEDKMVVYPSEISFRKPVYLIMTDISRSAAESYAMMMDAMPNVTLVGSNTLGVLSGMLGKSVDDFYVTISNQRLVNSDGKYFEATGVTPDIEITVFPRNDVMNGHLNAIRRVVKIINKHSRPETD